MSVLSFKKERGTNGAKQRSSALGLRVGWEEGPCIGIQVVTGMAGKKKGCN